jgi:hypothetical protein
MSGGRQVFPCRQTDGHIDMTKLIVAFLNIDKNKAELALQRIKPGFSRAQKFKVNLAPDYLPVERYICWSSKHPVLVRLKLLTCSNLKSVNAQVLTTSFYCVFAFSVCSTVKEPCLDSSA